MVYFVWQGASQLARKLLLSALEEFRCALKNAKYFEEYFARSARTDIKFCNDIGWFNCEGAFNQESCVNVHTINPYGSRDWRIIFKTWNLDHR